MSKDNDPKHLRVRKGENLPHISFLRQVPILMLPSKRGDFTCNGWKEPKRGNQSVAYPKMLLVRDPEMGNSSFKPALSLQGNTH